jgi:hypothetical protein
MIDTKQLTVQGLTPGQNYNVAVQIMATDSKIGGSFPFTTDPKQAVAFKAP